MRQTANILPALALVLTACTAPSDDSIDDVDDLDAKADSASYPDGVYQDDEATGDEMMELILLPDKSFIRTASWDWDGIRMRGTYSFTKWDDRKYIRFYDTDGELHDRYRYYLSGSVLKLRPTSTSSAPYQSMVSGGKGKAAWVAAIKADWFDERFDESLTFDPEAFSRTDINPVELPAAAKPAYDALVQEFGSNSVDLYTFTLHGSRGFEALAPDKVTLFDEAGAVIANGIHADDMFEFEWIE